EAAYVGNRGAWWLSTALNNYNALSQDTLKAVGLDINSQVDRTILRATIGSPGAGRFQNKLPYSGFPLGSTVAQSLRPFPQFTSGRGALGAREGRPWYVSLQAKAIQRLWHGLDAQFVFTYAKELQPGTEVFLPAAASPDVFNRQQFKTISAFSRPFVS